MPAQIEKFRRFSVRPYSSDDTKCIVGHDTPCIRRRVRHVWSAVGGCLGHGFSGRAPRSQARQSVRRHGTAGSGGLPLRLATTAAAMKTAGVFIINCLVLHQYGEPMVTSLMAAAAPSEWVHRFVVRPDPRRRDRDIRCAAGPRPLTQQSNDSQTPHAQLTRASRTSVSACAALVDRAPAHCDPRGPTNTLTSPATTRRGVCR
jgi:hypothetical protein